MAKCVKCVHHDICVRLGKPSLYGINKEVGCDKYLEVVRCKDCVQWHKSPSKGFHYCMYTMIGRVTKPDHFCSYGERKDNEC